MYHPKLWRKKSGSTDYDSAPPSLGAHESLSKKLPKRGISIYSHPPYTAPNFGEKIGAISEFDSMLNNQEYLIKSLKKYM